MGSQWVDGSPGWDSIGTQLANSFMGAPQKALNEMSAADEIAWNRRLRGAAIKASEAYPGALPEAAVAPRPYTAADIANPAILDAPLSALKPAGAGTETLTPGYNQIIDPEALALAQKQRDLAVRGGTATIMKDPSQWAPQLAYGSVAARGPADNAYDRAKDTFLTTGRYPTSEEKSMPAIHNLSIDRVDPDTGASVPTGRTVATQDGRTIYGTKGQPIGSVLNAGEKLTATGATDVAPKTPMQDEGMARERLAVLSKQVEAQGGVPTETQARQIQALADVAYKQTRVVEQQGDERVTQNVRPTPIPQPIIDMLARRQAAAEDQRNAIMSQNQRAAVPLPGAEGPTAPVAAPPPPVQPIVDPNAPQIVQTTGPSAIDLSHKIAQTQEVKTYLGSVSEYNNVVQAATQPATNATDLNIIYAIAKIFDPNTGVREGELHLAAGTGTIGEQLKSYYSKLFAGKGTLDPETRANLVEQARVRLAEYKNSADVVLNQAQKMTAKYKMDPELAIPAMPQMKEFKREDILKAAAAGGPAATAPSSPRATGVVAPADRVIGQKYPTPKGPMTWTGPKTGWQP